MRNCILLIGPFLLMFSSCQQENPSSGHVYKGKNIKIKIVGDIQHDDFLDIDGYRLEHLTTDTTEYIEDPMAYNPQILEMSFDQDSLIKLNSSFAYNKVGDSWRLQPVTTGFMAINIIKAFNTLTKNYRDTNYEWVGSTTSVAMSSTIELKTRNGKEIVLKTSKSYPAVVEATR